MKILKLIGSDGQLLSKILLALFCAIGAAIMGGAVVPTASLNADEGFYLAAAQRVMAGMVPYRDFGYTQTPLFPYFLGAIFKVIGFGLIEFRLTNVVIFACSAGLIGFIGTIRGGRWSSLAAVGVLLAAPHVIYFSVIGKTYAFGALCLLAMGGVCCSQFRGWGRLLLCGVLGACAIAGGPWASRS